MDDPVESEQSEETKSAGQEICRSLKSLSSSKPVARKSSSQAAAAALYLYFPIEAFPSHRILNGRSEEKPEESSTEGCCQFVSFDNKWERERES